MNRRTFLRRLATGAAVAVAAPHVPIAKLLAVPPAPPSVVPTAIRFVQQFDAEARQICRMDVLYGFRAIRPDLAVRLAVD